ncbi:MAG: hypothetical protein NT075_11195 [Chloroflexi bacterium]|nr:hypothetical protein [Chloroflexota bacterium]
MKLSDLVDELVIDHRKLTEYALNPGVNDGRHKAIIFERILGFTIENYQALVYQLETKCRHAEFTFRGEDKYGRRYQVDVLIDGINGAQATVRTGWIITAASTAAQLTTLYILRR